VLVAPSFATTLDFLCVTTNSGECPGLVPQLEGEVSNPAAGQVAFKFNNNGPMASNITEIYWDDDAGVLGGFGTPKYTSSGAGVVFVNDSTKPLNLPSGQTVSPSFMATASVDSANGANKWINPGEWLKVLFLLQNTKTYSDELSALEDGTLRIGMHIRSIGEWGGSESVVNIAYMEAPPQQGEVPAPVTLALVGAGSLPAIL